IQTHAGAIHTQDKQQKQSTQQMDEEEIQRKAVESLGQLPPEKSLPKLVNIARTHPNPDVRRAAVEAIGDLGTDPAFAALGEFAWSKNDCDLARTAVEAIAQYDQAAPKLIEIARRHSSVEVRRRAVESLGELEPNDNVVKALDDLVRADPDEDVQ